MMVGITGTPGTGKSTVAAVLAGRGRRVVHTTETVGPFVLGDDPERDTRVVDAEAWAAAFEPVDGVVEGHLAHLLPCDRIVVLRCRPALLEERLAARGYAREKVRENAEAEALDVILIETLDLFPAERVLEVDVTALGPEDVADLVEGFMDGTVAPSVGTIDWSSYLMEGL
ncbi:adenylate kinase [Methanofollis formosanus]|uniref:Putative adenylate kinase n=1 Tax=Methanofollis formosanus TaxID=299308 RepID=A0A8G1EF70_9EURY|nr:adenylate kinase family protein [Methanofollis formosanus]QYZ78538.1 adenylate kinase [Methanofollis formosanus]